MSAFWGTVRRKIPGLCGDRMLDAEACEKGIKFYNRDSGQVRLLVTWDQIFREFSGMNEMDLPPIHGPLRIVPADERES